MSLQDLKDELFAVETRLTESDEAKASRLRGQIHDSERQATEEKRRQAQQRELENTAAQLQDMAEQLSEIDSQVELLDQLYTKLHASITNAQSETSNEQLKTELGLCRSKLSYFSRPHALNRNVMGTYHTISELVNLPEVRS